MAAKPITRPPRILDSARDRDEPPDAHHQQRRGDVVGRRRRPRSASPARGLEGSSAWATMPVFAAGIIVVQVVSSRLWLARFRYGPLERAWRCITWWDLQPIRLRASAN
ncbi:hypothetical protein GCM10027271_03950 [Saccharopolyspora gloriosae]|uniref:DUF418 domain-containing protein n=1 Tax=Saccharopolyspora gloriosae TaxID=455344 RepID=A0A840NPP5_9PSEU|nr:DUF418 domain-containing protein [Saccharopolyspora gloriosae]MBB5071945.1 hypothetical protein [Saccharopolyspora gloriosae]